MLLDPSTDLHHDTPMTTPASTRVAPTDPDVRVLPAAPSTLPRDLRGLGRRARRDVAAARELAATLLGRRWSVPAVATATGLRPDAVRALAAVRRPATAASHVAAELAAAHRPAD